MFALPGEPSLLLCGVHRLVLTTRRGLQTLYDTMSMHGTSANVAIHIKCGSTETLLGELYIKKFPHAMDLATKTPVSDLHARIGLPSSK